ncbi:MAG: hypothetical protein V4506_19260 [Bacteroidota bacterium]
MDVNYKIPVWSYTTDLYQFTKDKDRLTEGKEIISINCGVSPQFVPEYIQSPLTKSISLDAMKVPRRVDSHMMHFYWFYAEYKCTKEEYEEWESKQPKLKK